MTKTKLVDDNLRSNILKIHEKVTKTDRDWITIIDALEGYGKSTLAGQIAYIYNPDITIDTFTFTTDELVTGVRNATKGDVLIMDEAGTNFFSRDAMTENNKLLAKLFMTIRQKNLYIILCLPSFFFLDTYLREHRVNNLIHIYKRGNYLGWNRWHTKQTSILGQKFKYYPVKADLQGKHTKEWPNKKVHKEYLKKKKETFEKYLSEIEKVKPRNMAGLFTVKQYSDHSGFSQSYIRKMINNNKLTNERHGGRIYIREPEKND